MAAKTRLGGRKELTEKKSGKVPRQSGIYLFRDKETAPLKVGKTGAKLYFSAFSIASISIIRVGLATLFGSRAFLILANIRW